ncbi:hypothetical protein N0V84_006920 [Fusarium piperis]|uniref:Uncharacterized protein n=1 Tax=Fusarium piperis TaxID=1435070 RepID=A0A9W9BMD6_9HYPO|nr:hypothetical protein N0V84_006920 [Fusarium piperis]
MRFTSVFVAGTFAAMAAAQSTTASISPAQQSQLDCLDDCPAGDVKCQSYCITVPSPNEDQVNATNECVAKCDKGKGSEADTEKYAACVQDCVANNYWKTVDGTPRETAASGGNNNNDDNASSSRAGASATGTGSAAASASASGSASGSDDASETDSDEASGTATGTAASSTSTGNAAPVLAGGVSLLGLFAAVLAL